MEKRSTEESKRLKSGVEDSRWIKEDRCQQIFHFERYPVRRNEKLRFKISEVQRPEGDLDR
jgi:hypothetical protein